MTAASRRVLVVVALLGVGAASMAAWAFWTSTGSGNAGATVASFSAPELDSPSVTNGAVTLSWSTPATPGAGAVDYSVARFDESGSAWADACATSTTVHILDTTCTEVPGDGEYVWRVTAYFHSWTATSDESDKTNVGEADSTPPTGAITQPAPNGVLRGSVEVSSNSADADSGVGSARFQHSPAGAGTWTTIGVPDSTFPYSVSWDTTSVADGLHDLRVVTVDNVGNAYASVPILVLVDNTAPSVSLSSASGAIGAFLNAGNVYFKANAAGSFGLVATVTDAGSGAASATYPVQATAGWTHAAETVVTPTGGPFASSTLSWSAGASTPGAYTVTATDAAGNTATGSVSFIVDSTAPAGSVTAPVAAANVRGSVSVTSSSTDAGSGVAAAQFQTTPHSAGAWTNVGTADTTSPYSAVWDTTALADGLYDLRVITTDNVGNTFTSATVASVRVDNTAPTGAVTGPLTDAILRGAITMSSDSADTGGSGITSAQFQRSPAGTNTWSNQGAADTTSPYAVTWTTTTSTPDGLYDLRVVTTDKAGNTFTSPAATNLRVDNTAPTGSVTAPAASANIRGTVSITSSSADAGSGVASAQFQSTPHSAGTWTNVGAADTASPYAASWDTTTFADGLYDLRVITVDVAGNSATSSTISSVRVDNTAPTGAVTFPAASANVRATITLTADSADTGSGVASALFQRSPAGTNTWTNVAAADTTSPYTASWVTTGVTDGLYDLQVITTDKSGNTLTSPLITDVRVDNTVPAVSLALAPGATGAYRSGTKIYFKANAAGSFGLVATVTDAGSGAASAAYPVQTTAGWTHAVETVTTPAGGPYSSSTFSWTSGASTPATYTVTVADAAGNTATSATTFTVDSTAPTGSVTAPVAAANVRGSVSVTSNSTDATAGVASAQFQSSPAGAGTWSNLGAADTLTPFATTWDTTTFTDGLYDLRVVTTDNVGNTFTSATIANVRVDNTAPTGSVTAPASNAFISGASVAVSANSADTGGSGVNSAQFQTSPRGVGTWTNLGAADTTSPYAVTWNTTSGYPDGLYDLQVVTTDKSGNTFASTITPVEIQNAAPTAAAVALVNRGSTVGKLEQGDQIVVTYTQTLAVSSLCSTWSGNLTDQSLSAAGDVTVALNDGGAGNDTVTVTSSSCTVHFGTINLGATGYVTGGNRSFWGGTASDTSTVAWTVATRTLTVTLGAPTGLGSLGTIVSSAAVYTADAAIKNAIGTFITGVFNTGTVPQF